MFLCPAAPPSHPHPQSRGWCRECVSQPNKVFHLIAPNASWSSLSFLSSTSALGSFGIVSVARFASYIDNNNPFSVAIGTAVSVRWMM